MTFIKESYYQTMSLVDAEKLVLQVLKNVMEEEGVTHMAAICAICKSQFTKVLPYYGMDMNQIVSIHQLVSEAIILTGQNSGDEEDEEGDEEDDDPDA